MSGGGTMVTEVMYRDELHTVRAGQVVLGHMPTGRRWVGLRLTSGVWEWWVGSRPYDPPQYVADWEAFTFERWDPSKHGVLPGVGSWARLVAGEITLPALRLEGAAR